MLAEAIVSAPWLRRDEPVVREEYRNSRGLSPRSLGSERLSPISPFSTRDGSPENAPLVPPFGVGGSGDAFIKSHPGLKDMQQSWRVLDQQQRSYDQASAAASDSRGGKNDEGSIPWQRPSVASGEETELGDDDAILASQQNSVEELVELFSSSALLEPMASLETEKLLTALDFLVYKSGETIAYQGDRNTDGLYFFFEGTARAQKTSLWDASTKILRTFEARSRRKEEYEQSESEKSVHRWISDDGEENDGESVLPVPPDTTNLWRYQAADYFGEFALWKKQPMSYSVVCDSVCRIVRIRRHVLERLGPFEDIVQKLHVVQDCLHDSRLRRQFDSFDHDKDGLLSMQEAWDLMRALGWDYSFEDFETGFPSMESAWLQALSYDDFFAFWDTCSFNDPLRVRSRPQAGAGVVSSSAASTDCAMVSTCSQLPVRHAGELHNYLTPSQLQERKPKTQHDLLPGGQDFGKELVADVEGVCYSLESPSVRSVSPGERQCLPDASTQVEDTSNLAATVVNALGSFASLITDESATKSQKLQTLQALKQINFSAPNHQTGSISLAIIKDQRCLKALLQTIGDEQEDAQVRRAAAGVVQACLQFSDSAAKMLLDRDLSAKMSVNEQRAAWRASFIASIAPDVASSADVEATPVLSAFNSLGSPQRDSKQSIDMQSLPVRGRDLQNEREAPSAPNTSRRGNSQRRARSDSPVERAIEQAAPPKMARRKRASLSPSARRDRKAPQVQDGFFGNVTRRGALRLSTQFAGPCVVPQVSKFICPAEPPNLEAEFEANRAKLVKFLLTVPHFECLETHNQFGKLVDMLQVKIFIQDDVIVRKGDRGRSCFFVMYMGCAQIHACSKEMSIHEQHSEEAGEGKNRTDALSASRECKVLPTEVFGFQSAALAHAEHKPLIELTTCRAASIFCTVLVVPYEAYMQMLRGETSKEGCMFMNNQQDRGAQMESAFRYLDHDGDGLLDHEDICKLCNYVGIRCDPTFAEKLCAVIGHAQTQPLDGQCTARFLVDLQKFSAWWEGLNFFDVNVDTMARELEDELESRDISRRIQEFEEEQEYIRRIRERKGTPPPPVTIVYDANGRRQEIIGDDSKSKFNLPQLQEKLRPPPKVDSEQDALWDRSHSWREFLPPPAPELWGSRLQNTKQTGNASGGLSSITSAARGSPKKALVSSYAGGASPLKKGKPPTFTPGNASPYAVSRGNRTPISPGSTSPYAVSRGNRTTGSKKYLVSAKQGFLQEWHAAERSCGRKDKKGRRLGCLPGEIKNPFPDLVGSEWP